MLSQIPWSYCSSVSCSIIDMRGFHSLKLIDFCSFYKPPHQTSVDTNISSNFTRTLMDSTESSCEQISSSTDSAFSSVAIVIDRPEPVLLYGSVFFKSLQKTLNRTQYPFFWLVLSICSISRPAFLFLIVFNGILFFAWGNHN